MKRKMNLVIIYLSLSAGSLTAQENPNKSADVAGNSSTDSTGLPGDHFSLQGALDLFKNASSLEDFEKKLNTEDNAVNNLDLNGDGDIDYIRVVDNMKDNAHAIALQVAVTETESQDVAVIELEKNADESAVVQIVGDEELYGESKIIEPADEKESIEQNKGDKGPAAPSIIVKHVWINVWFWPCVKFIFAPAYVVWVSPWYWHHYPGWWRPWRPHPWYWHHQHCMHYHAYYHPATIYRAPAAHAYYGPHRKTSVVVVNKHKFAHANYKAKKTGVKPAPVKSGPKPIKPGGKPAKVNGPKPVQKSGTKPAGKPTGPKPGGKPGGGGKGGKK